MKKVDFSCTTPAPPTLVLVGSLILLCTSSQLSAQEVDILCLGDETAHNFLVYLHGMDTPEPSFQEERNRARLTLLAEALHMRIAVIRATSPCEQNPLLHCWSQTTTEELEELAQAITVSATTCFGEEAQYGVLGFSNGGFAASRLIQYCVHHTADWMVATSSAGSWASDEPSDINECGRLFLLIGTDDHNTHPHTLNYYDHLLTVGADVQLITFDGGHELPYQPLHSLLVEVFGGAGVLDQLRRRHLHKR